jgi:RHS repeat-associated protein
LYSSFGEAQVLPSSTVENNLRFPGQYYDQETGLHYNYHRYYDPTIGRYLRADPIGLEGGVNEYCYTFANPINSIDNFGLMGKKSPKIPRVPSPQEIVAKCIAKWAEWENDCGTPAREDQNDDVRKCRKGGKACWEKEVMGWESEAASCCEDFKECYDLNSPAFEPSC